MKLIHEVITLPRKSDICSECTSEARFCVNRNGKHSDAFSCTLHLTSIIMDRENDWE